jgi:hypothetical protein
MAHMMTGPQVLVTGTSRHDAFGLGPTPYDQYRRSRSENISVVSMGWCRPSSETATNVFNPLALAGATLGMEIRIAHPDSYGPKPQVRALAEQLAEAGHEDRPAPGKDARRR